LDSDDESHEKRKRIQTAAFTDVKDADGMQQMP